MTNIGTRLLNQYVAHYAIRYLQKVNFQHTNSPKNNSTWKFLRLSGISWDTDPNLLGDIGRETAKLQRELVLSGAKNTSIRFANRNSPLIAHGPQSWLIHTYEQTLNKIFELDQGTMEYGLGKDAYRDIEENVMAARMMFENAAKSLADKLVSTYKDVPNLGLFEGGAGNGAAMLTNLLAFHQQNIFPDFLISDIDPKTKGVAEKYFRKQGFPSRHFPWMQADIGSPKDLATVANHFPWHKLVLNVNFIIHEWEPIAEKFFAATSQSMPNADLAVSEFFVPENPQIDPDFPWWFVYIHEITDQYLRTKKDFLSYPIKYGYELFDHIDHQVHNGEAVTSTLFFRK